MTWVSYAQNYEDVVLARALSDVHEGRYVDVGAHDPRVDSVTRAFYERGWSGVNLEPVAHWHARLEADRPGDVNLRVLAGEREGQRTLYEVAGTGLSTLDATLARGYRERGMTVTEVQVPMRRLDAILDEAARGPIHFLKVDVEGAEEQVLRGLDLARWRPWVIVVEATAPGSTEPSHQRWEPMLLGAGYRLAWFDGLNRFYLADEHASRAPRLALAPNVFDEFIRYGEHLLREDVAQYRTLLARERERADRAEAELALVAASRVWRATAPIRKAAAAVRRAGAALRARGNATGPGDSAGAGYEIASAGRAEQAAVPDAPSHALPHAPPVAPPVAPSQQGGAATAAAPLRSPLERRVAAALAWQPPAPSGRPRLALVAPLPPARSGVADYCVPLLPELARRYAVDLIVDQTEAAPGPIPQSCALRSAEWFERNAASFDRVVYHFGNSPFHAHMLDLLARHPGTVVMHDVVMADLLDHLERSGARPHAFTRALYASHGWAALAFERDRGRQAAVRAYACCGEVLDAAEGAVVNSRHAARVAHRCRGGPGAIRVSTLPREVPAGDRDGARRRLGIAADAFVVCSFGLMGPTKLNHRLLAAWAATALAADPACRLVFVGEGPDGDYGASIAVAVAALPDPSRATITGRVERAAYADWLDAADVAVQLRAETRGETSGAVIDCLAHGLPLIVNAHGPAAEIEPGAAMLLADDFADAGLAGAIAQLRRDAGLRAGLGAAAREVARRAHDPVSIAAAHAEAIEADARDGPRARIRALASDSLTGPADEAALRALAERAADTLPAPAPPQLLVDVTALALHDLRSGIQRVVRSVASELLERPPEGVRVEPVYLDGGRYRYARRFACGALGIPSDAFEDEPVDAYPGDIFLGLDLATDAIAASEPLFARWRQRGVSIHFVVYDLLPVEFPDCFPEVDGAHYRRWLGAVCRVAHGLVAISRSVAGALEARLEGRPERPAVGWFHLGADIAASLPSRGLAPDVERELATIEGRPTVLMVGTVEPRKGHAQALAAFDALWARGHDVGLAIVGRAGWMVDALVERLRGHPERGLRLHWFESASDELLERLYRAARGMLLASRGEGFGLPLIEAAQHGLPVLARDVPVFREVAGGHAAYFVHDEPEALADAIASWLARVADGTAPDAGSMPRSSWAQATQALAAQVIPGEERRAAQALA